MTEPIYDQQDADNYYLSAENRLLRRKVAAYNAAADKFIAKVVAGAARSVETYQELSAARQLPENTE